MDQPANTQLRRRDGGLKAVLVTVARAKASGEVIGSSPTLSLRASRQHAFEQVWTFDQVYLLQGVALHP